MSVSITGINRAKYCQCRHVSSSPSACSRNRHPLVLTLVLCLNIGTLFLVCFKPLALRLSPPRRRSRRSTGPGTRHNPSTQSVSATYFTPSTEFSINSVMEPPLPRGFVGIFGQFFCPSPPKQVKCRYVITMNTFA